MREAQLVEHHYHGMARDAEDKKLIETKSKAPPRHEQELFLGSQKSHHESMVSPALIEWVAKGLERESSILKQARKAREERKLARG